MEVKNIPIERINPSPLNPRKTFDEESLNDLADNIKQQGLLQPITVRPIPPSDIDPLGGDFEIICGERRYRACIINKMPTIPCLVRTMSDADALDAMITENLQRQDVNPIEEAFAFAQLTKTGKTIEDIALRFGKSTRFISERIKLDALLPELKEFVKKGWMTIGAGMYISKLSESDQRKFYERVDDHEDGDEVISKSGAKSFTNDLFMDIDRADWEEDFQGSCGTTCAKCPFNNANAGCLFYEMKIDANDACCTNRDRWKQKHKDWLYHIVDQNADVLVKGEGQLESGKTIIATHSYSYYNNSEDAFNEFVAPLVEKGYRVIKLADYFSPYGYSRYDEDDERLQEKLDNGYLYRVLLIEAGWKGIEIHIRYFELSQGAKDETEVKAMELVKAYKEASGKNEEKKVSKIGEMLRNRDPLFLPTEPLTKNEQMALLILLVNKCSYPYRDHHDLVYFRNEKNLKGFVEGHPEEWNRIVRDYIRNEVSGAGVMYNHYLAESQALIVEDWMSEEAANATKELDAKLQKRLAKIEEQLKDLGYDTEGNQLIPQF